MTFTGVSFRLTDLETGRTVAHALLCPEARYAGLVNHGATRLDRQFLTPFQWLLIEQQLARRIDTGPLHRSSAIVALLLEADRRADVIVHHLVNTPLDVSPDEAAAVLDSHLLEFSAMPAYAVKPER
jgi:hypothetical protein